LKGTLDVEPCQSGEAHGARRHGSSHVREMPDFDPNLAPKRGHALFPANRVTASILRSSTNGTSCVYRTDRTNLAMHQPSHVLNYVDSPTHMRLNKRMNTLRASAPGPATSLIFEAKGEGGAPTPTARPRRWACLRQEKRRPKLVAA
jgi:hypothetical protein